MFFETVNTWIELCSPSNRRSSDMRSEEFGVQVNLLPLLLLHHSLVVNRLIKVTFVVGQWSVCF